MYIYTLLLFKSWDIWNTRDTEKLLYVLSVKLGHIERGYVVNVISVIKNRDSIVLFIRVRHRCLLLRCVKNIFVRGKYVVYTVRNIFIVVIYVDPIIEKL